MRSVRLWCAVAAAGLWCSQASAAWQEAKSKHFIIYANQSPDALRVFAQRLERFDQAVRYVRNMPDPDMTDAERLTIFVLPDADSIAQLYGYQWVRGFYLTRDSGAYAFVPQRSGVTMTQGDSGGTGTIKDSLTSEAVFFHEYAHHLQLQSSTFALPMWVSEGFAEFFATTKVTDNGSVEIGRNPAYRSMALVWTRIPVEKMVGGDRAAVEQYGMDGIYARGWLLTHYLSMTPERKGQLRRYIDEIQAGKPPVDAAKSAFGDLSVLDRELDRYAAQRSFLGFTVSSNVIQQGP